MDEIMGVAKEDENITISEEKKRIMESLESIQSNVVHNVHVRSEPVVDILSVRLYNNNRETKGFWGIYGNIYVYDAVKSNSKCDIYERKEEDNDPEIVPFSGGALGPVGLTGPDDVMSMDKPTIFIDIWDKISGETIISQFASLDKTIDTAKQDHQFEQFKKLVVCGTSCYVEVEYLALTFGVFAPIEVQLDKKQEAGSGSNDLKQQLEVYGTISANYNLLCSEKKVNRIVLFEIKEDSNESEWVTLGRPIILSRSVVAVPAYSSITIQVELWDRATKKLIVQGSIKFDAMNYAFGKTIAGVNCLNAEVVIVWKEPFMLDDPAAKRGDLVWGLYSHFLPMRAIEVFSIFIGRQSDALLRLHGMVTFWGDRDRCVLFKRDKDNPYILPPGSNILPLEGPNETLLPGEFFNMSVDLEDVDGRVSIKGFATSSYGLDDRKSSWFDRLLCSVVKGEHDNSFAAIHYTAFGNASKVTLKVHFFFKGEHTSQDLCKIYGSIVALCDEYGNRTNYEKLYFRNVLFERLEENPLEVPCMNFDMKLSKFVFAAPQKFPLQIVVDLSCLSSHSSGLLKETKQFRVCSDVCDDVVIEGDKFGVIIGIEWSRADGVEHG